MSKVKLCGRGSTKREIYSFKKISKFNKNTAYLRELKKEKQK